MKDYHAGTDFLGEFRRLTNALKSDPIALPLLRIPPHSDFEQGTVHHPKEIEEIYIVTKGTQTMCFGDYIVKVDGRCGSTRST
ncbi:MAG: hypothetical protein KGH64_02815 [Candidatus Micrarchaeota archaeon]|nr:hypothetical protein [Candidatus Micrarchaeota archaeon]MDE1834244.1 hypothetical protein [Candidatus Micrarchaeota archaeon]MDE1859547.1 hypothetical protein [Candidatus Micrarchaeota archaeon]